MPDSISKIISNISSDKTKFDNAATFYNDVLSTSGYKENFTYQKDLPPSNAVRQRKITCFFPKTNKLHKMFNRNNFRVSYSCLPNFASTIKSRNNRTYSKETAQGQPKCNCRRKGTCHLEGNCLDKELTYQCNLKQNAISDGVNYNSLTENTFKDQFYKYGHSFKYEGMANSTELSNHFWGKKRKGIENPIMYWSVIDHAKPYTNRSKRGNL